MNANITQADAFLFKPQTALRVRPGSDQGTPYPPEIPKGENPPDGVAIDYYLKDAASKLITLEILGNKGEVVRKYSSDDKAAQVDEKTLDIPMYWIKPSKTLSAGAGMHRFYWDLHYASLTPSTGARRRGGFAGPWALPTDYTVRLTVNDKTYTQPITVKIDRKSTRLNSSHIQKSRMPSSA